MQMTGEIYLSKKRSSHRLFPLSGTMDHWPKACWAQPYFWP